MEIELKDPRNLVIAVTGFANKLMIPPPDFLAHAALHGYSRIILNDPSKSMFLCGVEGVFDSFDHMVERLQEQVKKMAPQHLVVVGTSGGAHTALLLGHLLRANLCVVFSPYPYLSDQELLRLNDPAFKSFHQVLERVRKSPAEVHIYFDVKQTIQSWNGVTEYFVHVSEGHQWDVKRASTLTDVPHLKIIQHPGDLHAVVNETFIKLDSLSHCFKLDQKQYFKKLNSWAKVTIEARKWS